MNEHLISAASEALDIAAAGWPVFPCTGKRPITRHGFHDATTDEWTIMEWWARHPGANVGVALPEGVIVVDVDDIEAFEATGLDLPPAPEQHTPGGGLHRFYRLDKPASQSVKRHAGVDTRVGGQGYVISWEPRWALSTQPLPLAPGWVYS